jgi:hypothetical protein
MISSRRFLILPVAALAFFGGALIADVQGQCGPFTDVSPGFCPYILEMYYLGITAGTSPTTFSPDNPVTRGQAAVFVSKGLSQSLARSTRRAALGQWWTSTPRWDLGLGVTQLTGNPIAAASDGLDIWTANAANHTASRVRASDGRLLETWTGIGVGSGPVAVLSALGRVLVLSGGPDNGALYSIDPSQAAGDATLLAAVPNGANSFAFDGVRVFANNTGGVAQDVFLSVITPTASAPWSVQTVHDANHLLSGGLLYDGTRMWLASFSGELLRLNSDGTVADAIPLGASGRAPIFDGTNLWVPTGADGIAIVRADNGVLVTTLAETTEFLAFDGVRVLSVNPVTQSISVWRAADLTELGTFGTGGATPAGACSDGLNFFVTLPSVSQLARF